jgi:hypothetical protein
MGTEHARQARSERLRRQPRRLAVLVSSPEIAWQPLSIAAAQTEAAEGLAPRERFLLSIARRNYQWITVDNFD